MLLISSLWNTVKLIWIKNPSNSEPEFREDEQWGTTFYQIFISLGPLIFCMGVGGMMGFSGIFLPQLEDESGEMNGSNSEISSWIAASAVLSMAFASVFGGFLMEKFGRKRAHIIPAVPGIIGWLIMAFSGNIPILLVGRVLTGISCGLFAPITSSYVGEITSPSIRPFVLGCISLSVTIGTLLCHLIGSFNSWRITAFFCMIFPTFGCILTFFSEETPTWLFRKNRTEEACAAFNRIRGKSDKSQRELGLILERRKDEGNLVKTMEEIVREVTTKPEIFKPLLVVVLYFISAQFAGINIVTFYAIDIVKMSLGHDFQNSYWIMLAMDFVRVITSVLACILLKNLNRRHLVIGGGVGSLICLLTLSISNFLLETIESAMISVYLPLVSLLGYVFFISISLVPLPWCLAGELLPQEVKGFACGVLCFTSFCAFFVAIKCAPLLFTSLGTGSTYLVFSGSTLFGTTMCAIFLPETKNKTLNEIADTFRKK